MNRHNTDQKSDHDVLSQLQEIASAVMFAAEGGTVDQVLERIAHVARDLARARYAALGVPDGRGGLRYFKVSGMTIEAIREVEHLPIGLGLLGAIMEKEQVIRLARMQDDPRSVGFPAGHPPMTSLLGVPIKAGPQLMGILYLCDREDDQPFDERDERLIETVAGYAAVAIAGAMLNEQQSLLRTLEERERIGMELHDGVIQSLYAIGMHLDLMRAGDKIDKKNISQIIDSLNLVIEDIRRYILDLKSAGNVTIYSCIRDILNRLYVPSDLQVEIDAPEEPPPFTVSTFEAICQIANEAISNTVRHAEATRLVIRTLSAQNRFQITIVDDGKGFDLDAINDHAGLGLHNMKQRARLYDGNVHIDTAPGQGTRLTITIPTTRL
jgi:signal transduction histidine kinase